MAFCNQPISYNRDYKHCRPYLRKPGELIINRPYSFLNTLLKRPSNAHHLTHTLHATAQQLAHAVELLQVPSRDFANHVVQRRLEARARDFGYRVLDLVERDTEAEFGGDEGEWVAGGFGCESGGTG